MKVLAFEDGYDIEVKDLRKAWNFDFKKVEQTEYEHIAWPPRHPVAGTPVILRDYQVDVINKFLENLDDEDKDDVLDRFEDDEAAYGDDEEMDMDVDMGDEELDMDMDDEELDMGMEDEEEMAMESLKNRVGSLLESYISKKEKKRKNREKSTKIGF